MGSELGAHDHVTAAGQRARAKLLQGASGNPPTPRPERGLLPTSASRGKAPLDLIPNICGRHAALRLRRKRTSFDVSHGHDAGRVQEDDGGAIKTG